MNEFAKPKLAQDFIKFSIHCRAASFENSARFRALIF
jgi:hypothetical protein